MRTRVLFGFTPWSHAGSVTATLFVLLLDRQFSDGSSVVPVSQPA